MRPSEHQGHAIFDALERVLASPGFARNERLSRFLRFLVERHLEGRDEEIKESLIAVEVFGRKPDYDPRLDSIVRTEAGRLRARLTEYYAGDGHQDPYIIDVPKGGYVPRVRQRDAVPEPRTRRAGRPVWIAVACACAILAAGVAATIWWQPGHSREPIRVAVLPLENLSPPSDHDYFADGLTDELIRELSIIEGLEVRSQTSSFAFQGKNVREAGRQLDVDYILEGSVLRAGTRLRINMQMVRVSDDVSVWSGAFERLLTDVFAIQDEISRDVVNNLRLQLGRGRRRYETSVEAYDFYLQGRAFILRRRLGISGMLRSIEPFEQAVARDPSFAPAYAGLGAVYAIRSIQFPVDHPPDELEKMRAATEKAVELDPLLAEAHAARALAYARDARWAEAEQSFHRAIELDPNRSGTRTDFALWMLYVLGRNEEALAQLRMAQKADPLSPDVHMALALVLISLGQYEQAAAECLKMPAEDTLWTQCAARARIGQGRFDEAIPLLLNDPNPQSEGFLGYAYARSGRREEAEKLAAHTEFPNTQTLIFAGLGDEDRTLAALDRMAVLGAQRVGMYLNSPELAPLRGNPRLSAFRKRVGLPDDR